MKTKLNYMLAGYALLIPQFFLVGTRFNIVSMGFGVVAAIMFINALTIKRDK